MCVCHGTLGETFTSLHESIVSPLIEWRTLGLRITRVIPLHVNQKLPSCTLDTKLNESQQISTAIERDNAEATFVFEPSLGLLPSAGSEAQPVLWILI